MREILGFIVLVQGFGAFVARTFFDRDWGLLHRMIELPTAAYLGVGLAGLALIGWAQVDRKRQG
jgi:hypothetical protein